MRVFVFEYVTGGGGREGGMLSSLAAEGDLLLEAVVSDLVEVAGVDVVVARDRRLDFPPLPVELHWVDDDWRAVWAECLASCDAVLPITPRANGVLAALCRSVEASGTRLLNSSAATVALAADRQAMLDRLARGGVPIVPSRRAVDCPHTGDASLVLKPDRGAGCQDIHLVRDERALAEFLANQPDPLRWLVQPHVLGRSASLSLLVSAQDVCVLGCNAQRIAQVDDGFVLLGCAVNGLRDARDGFRPLAEGICAAVPGLWGYVDVDFVATDTGPVVLEIIPGLTMSYAGLSRSTGCNVAELLIGLGDESGTPLPPRLEGACVHVDLEFGCVA